MLPGNQEAIEAWNTILFEKFLKYRHVVSAGLALHGDRALELHPPQPGWRVVDIGCGFGETTLAIADRVGPRGVAVGVDAASRFLDVARSEAQGRDNVRYDVADVEEHVPGGPYDMAFSRMGTMFFASPVIALRNIRKALVPGGKLCMVVWRKKDANEGFALAERVVREILGDPPKGDQVTCGPGPFSMASPDLVSDQLLAAGYHDPTFTRCDADMCIGKNLADAIEFAMKLGPAGEVVRLAGEAAVARHQEIVSALEKVFAPFQRDNGLWAPATTWIVTARS